MNSEQWIKLIIYLSHVIMKPYLVKKNCGLKEEMFLKLIYFIISHLSRQRHFQGVSELKEEIPCYKT